MTHMLWDVAEPFAPQFLTAGRTPISSPVIMDLRKYDVIHVLYRKIRIYKTSLIL